MEAWRNQQSVEHGKFNRVLHYVNTNVLRVLARFGFLVPNIDSARPPKSAEPPNPLQPDAGKED